MVFSFLVVTLLALAIVRPSSAGHCYSISGQSACESSAQGSPCAYCNGQCQMASDGCEAAPENLPGDPFFEDFSSLLTGNPTQYNYGVAVTDIDGDGSFEFVVAGYTSANQAYKWDAAAGNFKDIASGHSALQDSSKKAIGVAACDVDGDGYEELYILNTDAYSGSTPMTSDRLIDRDPSGTYSDLFSELQNQNSANNVAGRSCACLDRLGTGRYGVVVANYGGPMRLFEMAEGDRTVTDVASGVGMAKTTGGRALVAGPLVTNKMDVFANNEGWSGGGRRLEDDAVKHVNQTNFLAPERRLSHRKNFLFANNGNGEFLDLAAETGLIDADYTGRGTALFDSNGDGMLDVVYGNWQGVHRLFIQEKDANGCRKFVDSATTEMAVSSNVRTVIVADFDNDGYEEMFWNNIPGNNRLFRKLPTDSDWVQVNIGDALETTGYGTGGAIGDFDGDGRLELIISRGESAAQPLTYYRPRGGVGNHWIRVLPLTAQGAPARGAVVTIRAGGRTQLRVIDAGSGYLCQMEPVAHFGLGALTTVEEVIVTWPDGASQNLGGFGIDQLHRVHRHPGLVVPVFSGRCDKRDPFGTISNGLPTAPPQVVMEMTVAGVSYNDLLADATAKTAFETTIKTQVAASAGYGVTMVHVTLVLSAGSVNVEATVAVPPNANVATVQSTLSTAQSSGVLETSVATTLAAHPSVAAVATGSITASVASPVIATPAPTMAPADLSGATPQPADSLVVPTPAPDALDPGMQNPGVNAAGALNGAGGMRLRVAVALVIAMMWPGATLCDRH